MMRPIEFTAIEGIRVGHAEDLEAATGCTVVISEAGATAGSGNGLSGLPERRDGAPPAGLRRCGNGRLGRQDPRHGTGDAESLCGLKCYADIRSAGK